MSGDRWQALKDYLGAQIDADDEVHRGFLESGDHARAAAFGGLLAANRNTLAKMTELGPPAGDVARRWRAQADSLWTGKRAPRNDLDLERRGYAEALRDCARDLEEATS